MEFDRPGERSTGRAVGNDSFHLDHKILPRYVTPGFKPFSILTY